jgi:proteasome lid subunit RPN8/RPN11
VVTHSCQSAHPAEVCGFLAARDGVLAQAHPVANIVDDTPDTCGFRMDPTAQIPTIRAIEEAGLDLGASYHSPGTTPRPRPRPMCTSRPTPSSLT